MRVLFLIPDFLRDGPRRALVEWLVRHPTVARKSGLRRYLVHPRLHTPIAWGGTLNIMRHCAVARAAGADARLASPRGRDTYGEFGIVDLPYVAFARRRPDDAFLVPDQCTELIDRIEGPVIAYMQVPYHVRADFDYRSPRVQIWTDSELMLEVCRRVFPDKPIRIVPNVVDSGAFPFVPQPEREPGLLMAFPRKGPEFIRETELRYAALGGRYWRFEKIDGLPFNELARRMRRPQAFLASAEYEGCALPPQECMAAGIVVVGRSAKGANYAMVHGRTAMVAETPVEAAAALVALEDEALRVRVAEGAREHISRFFPSAEPRELWVETLAALGALEARPAADRR